MRGMGTSFRCNDFWVRLGGQTLVMIGRWYSRQPLTNHKKRFSTQPIPGIIAPKACTHSPYSFWSREYGGGEREESSLESLAVVILEKEQTISTMLGKSAVTGAQRRKASFSFRLGLSYIKNYQTRNKFSSYLFLILDKWCCTIFTLNYPPRTFESRVDCQFLFGELLFATNVWAINDFERTAWLMFLKVKEIDILSEEDPRYLRNLCTTLSNTWLHWREL